MTGEKFVVRLLTADDQLLGWQEVWCEPRPEGQRASCPFWPANRQPTQLPIEQTGTATKITVHWCDLDIARTKDLMAPVDVTAGMLMAFHWLEPVWLVSGMQNIPLPAVTLRSSVTLGPDPAQVGAVSR